jgi:hypothetical protein
MKLEFGLETGILAETRISKFKKIRRATRHTANKLTNKDLKSPN